MIDPVLIYFILGIVFFAAYLTVSSNPESVFLFVLSVLFFIVGLLKFSKY
jgi:hypothetical protein